MKCKDCFCKVRFIDENWEHYTDLGILIKPHNAFCPCSKAIPFIENPVPLPEEKNNDEKELKKP